VEEEDFGMGISEFGLKQNYPNPFNKLTAISYQIPNSYPASNISPAWPVGRPSGGHHVLLNIYDITGRLVETLVNEPQKAGIYNIDWKSKDIASGVYFYRLKTDNFTATQKMILLR
jgi:hypothetical protein